jgi:hypothetical protein
MAVQSERLASPPRAARFSPSGNERMDERPPSPPESETGDGLVIPQTEEPAHAAPAPRSFASVAP